MEFITATDYAKQHRVPRPVLLEILKYLDLQHGERITDKNTFLTINVV